MPRISSVDGKRNDLMICWHSMGIDANTNGIDHAYYTFSPRFGLNEDVFGLGRNLQQLDIRTIIGYFQSAVINGAGRHERMPYL